MKLLDLGDPLWKAYPGAYGSVREEVRALMGEPAGPQIQLRRLKEQAEDDEHLAFDNLCESLSHQMTFYPAMYVVLPYIVKFLGLKSGDYEWKRLIFSEIGQCLAADAFFPGEARPGAPQEILESYQEAAEILAEEARRFLKDCRKQLRKEGAFERRWLLLGLYGLFGERLEAYVMNLHGWESCCVQCGQCGWLDEDLTLSEPKQRRKIRPARLWQKEPASFRRFRKILHQMGDWEGEELLAWYYGTYTCPECGQKQPVMEALIRAFDPNFQEPDKKPAETKPPARKKFAIPGKDSEPAGISEAEPDASAKTHTPGSAEISETKPETKTGTESKAQPEAIEEKPAEAPEDPPDVLEDNALNRVMDLCRDYPSVLAMAERGEYREAADWCAEYLGSVPDWRLHILRGWCFKAMGKTPELDRSLTAALELEPDNILILRARCPTVATTNRYRRQIEDLSRLLELDPDHRCRYLEARAYRRHWTGDEQGALQDLRDALSEEPGLWRRSVDFRTLWEKFGLTETDAGNFQG